jgi:hypothetical protein
MFFSDGSPAVAPERWRFPAIFPARRVFLGAEKGSHRPASSATQSLPPRQRRKLGRRASATPGSCPVANALSFETGSAPSTLPGCVLKYYAISVWIFRMSVRADRTGCASPAIADLSIRLGAGLFPTTLAPRRRSFSAGCANAAPADPAKVSNRRRTTNRTRKPAPR